MPYPPQRADAADWMATQIDTNRAAHTAANSGLLPTYSVPMYPIQWDELPRSTSSSWVTLWQAQASPAQPKYTVGGFTGTTVGTTAELRVTVDAVQIGSIVVVPAGTYMAWSVVRAAWPSGVLFAALVGVDVRVTGGAGEVRVGVSQSYLAP